MNAPVDAVLARPRRRPSVLAAVLLASACATSQPSAPSASMPVSPPAVSAFDDAASVTWALADSFDVLANGKCAGRSDNAGMHDGARVQLRGDTDGGSVWATARRKAEA